MNQVTDDNLILAGDIGGTKTNLAIFSQKSGLENPVASATYASGDYTDLAVMLADFLDSIALKVRQAAFGVAGPVFDGRAKITKLPWIIDRCLLEKEFGLDNVIIVNDLVATAHGLPTLGSQDLLSLNSVHGRQEAPQAIIAPGTGLGETFMIWEGNRYRPYPTEGGHTPFAPANELQDRLLGYLRARYSEVSNDLVCSGRGIPLLYGFLREIEYAVESESVAMELASSLNLTPVIVRAALGDNSSPLCVATLDLFTSILASEAANLALKTMATGGVFLGGGMPPRIVPILQRNFMTSFIGRGVLRELLAEIPVQVIMNPMTALLGAARLLLFPYRPLDTCHQ